MNGVQVVRFAADAGRDPSFHPFSAALLADPDRASLEEAEQWIDLQGPVVPELVEAAIRSDADALIFYPYLYYPTVRLIDRVRTPTILHPAAHDEPALRLPVFPRVFDAADGLVFQTAAERELVQRRFTVANHRQLLLGLGVDDPRTSRRHPVVRPARPGQRSGVRCPADPYLVCLGRVDRNKGSLLLADLFAAYKQRHPGPLRLVLAGPVVEPPEAHPDIDVVGPVSEAAQVGPARGGRGPGVAVTLGGVLPGGGRGLECGDPGGGQRRVCRHRRALSPVRRRTRALPASASSRPRWTASPATRSSVSGSGRNGRAYVDRWFRWPRVIDRYAAFVESVVAAA